MSSFNWRRQLQKSFAQFTRKQRPTGRGAIDANLGVEALEVRLVPAINFVKDINPGLASSNPNAMVNADGILFFAADDGTHGDQLWQSDGTSAGTTMVADINPNGSSNPQDLTAVDGNVFFSANDGVHGSQLWMYDASTQTVAMVSAINPNGSANPQNITAFGSQVIFSANDGLHGQELWISDGTSANTQMVSDINPGPTSSSPADLTVFSNGIYFSADDGTHGRELWKTDGTSADTVLVDDIVPGPGSSSPNQLTPVGATLYFVATTPGAGTELWQSDGDASTQMTDDIQPGTGSSNPTDLTNIEDQSLFFAADDGVNGNELWRSVVGSNTANMVADINPGSAGSNPAAITDDFGTVLFIADDGTHGAQLWSSTGSDAEMVALINPNGDAFQRLPGNQFAGPTVFSNGLLIFSANDGVHGFEPWISNGTSSGTFMAQDINPGSASSFPLQFTDVFGTVFFTANDGSTGFELYSVSANERISIPIELSITPPDTSTVGQSVTMTVSASFTATPDMPPPTGTVVFTDGGSTIFGTATFNAGVATLVTGALPAGFNNIFANYEGDGNYQPAQAFATESVDPGTSTPTTTTLEGDPNPSTVGQPVTFQANVTFVAGTIGGVMDFFDGSNLLGSVLVDGNGNASFTDSSLSAGDHTISALYEGTTDFESSTSNFIQTVNPGPVAITSTTGSGNPNPATLNQPVTLTATVTTGSGTPTGVVQFVTGTTTLGVAPLDTNGIATLTLSNLPAGAISIAAIYGGSPQALPSSNSFTQQVGQSVVATTTTVSGAPSPSTVGQTVTFTATVTSTSGTPTGSVDFSEGTNDFGTVTLDANGQATKQISTLALGSHTITATFVGNTSFATSSNTTPQVVNSAPPAQTATTVIGTPNPSTVGQTVTFTVSVVSNSGIPTGSVDFTEGTTDFGSVTLDSNGHATKQISTLAAGSHFITGTFIGNASFATSNDIAPQDVNLATTSTTVSGTPNPSTVGQTVTFTATVTSGSGTPTGSVDFTEGMTDFGSVTLDANGQATKQISTLALGSHTITATFIGNTSFATSANTTPQAVNSPTAATTSTSVSGTPNPSTTGQTVTFTATVTSGSGTPTGSVDFSEGTTDFGTVTLDANGQATKQISTLALGSHTITATFVGNTSFATSTNTIPQVVNSPTAATTSTTVSGASNPSTTGQTVTFTAIVTSGSGTPTGSVDFSEGTTDFGTVTLDANGQATKQISTLALGSHTIMATFVGNTSFATSSNTTPQVVNSPTAVATSTTVSGTPNPSTTGQAVTFTATVTSGSVTPTGSVDFSEGTTDFGTVTLDANGQATKQISTLALGSHTITATYLGSTNFAASSRTTNQVVNSPTAVTTTTTVAGSPNPSTVGQTVTFAVTVTSSSGIPSGSVDFTEGATDFGTATLNGSGQATIQISSLAAGSHTITATFMGNTDFTTSSGTAPQVVNAVAPVTTSTTLSISPNPANAGQVVTFTASVSAATGQPTGQVVFSEGSNNLGTATLNAAGQASIQVSTLAVGAHTVTATFQANASFSTSSNTQSLTVQNSGASSNALFVTQLYHDLLQRTPEQQGLDSWVQLIVTGTSRTVVAYDIEQSPEYLTRIINSVYAATLLRAPDPLGFANSVQFLKSGDSSRQLQALLQASNEYFVVRGGNTEAGFVNSIYLDSLGRPAEAATQAALVPVLNAGYSRLALATSVATSPEANSRFVSTVYTLFLGRSVDAPSLQIWTDFLVRGGQDTQVVAGIMGSDEYFARAQSM